MCYNKDNNKCEEKRVDKMEKYGLYIFIGFVVLMTFITAIAYGWDKRKAISGKWRTKEKTLLLMSLLGGALGGLYGLYVIRHKNKHWYFVAINIIGLLLIGSGLFLVFYHKLY